jgi:hypothetical protein
MTTFQLPRQPSTNALWRSNRGRGYRSKRYTDRQCTAGPASGQCHRPGVDIHRRGQDLDNIATKDLAD